MFTVFKGQFAWLLCVSVFRFVSHSTAFNLRFFLLFLNGKLFYFYKPRVLKKFEHQYQCEFEVKFWSNIVV